MSLSQLLSRSTLLLRRLAMPLRSIGRRQIVACIAAAAFLWGAGDSRPRAAHAVPNRPRPWFDAKGAFVFPLGKGPLPQTREQFVESLALGWKSHLRFSGESEIVHVNGGRFPALGSLHMQLGGGVIDVNRPNKEPPLRPSGKVENRLAVRDFDLNAEPLIQDKTKLNIHVSATDARLDVEHDQQGRPMMMLADAKNATFRLHCTNADLERILVMDLNTVAQRYAVSIHKAMVKINAVNNRAVDVDLHLSTTIAFIPAGLHFQAHLDIDNEMYAKLSRLKCEGDDALGPLIMGLIRPGLSKLEGKSRPVFSFPTGQLKLRDVKIQGGDEVEISATFAR